MPGRNVCSVPVSPALSMRPRCHFCDILCDETKWSCQGAPERAQLYHKERTNILTWFVRFLYTIQKITSGKR